MDSERYLQDVLAVIQGAGEWRRETEGRLRSGPLGLGVICRDGLRVRTISLREGDAVLHRVVGCGESDERCGCHAQWDARWRDDARMRRDARVDAVLWTAANDGEAGEADAAVAAIVALGYREDAARWRVASFMDGR